MDEQRWIDGLLRSSAVSISELPRDDMVASLRNSIASRNRQSRLLACGLAAAAMILIAVGWIAIRHHTDHHSVTGAAPVNQIANDRPHSGQLPQATFVTESNVIAVPVASSHPDVTVIRIYPAYEPAQETQTALIEPETQTYDPWDTDTNGG
jgi:hypothetical protein